MERKNPGEIQDFTDLEVWQETHEFILAVYKITENLPREERFGITTRLRRASISINTNIAEGFGRWYYKDKVRFYYQARGSLSEAYNLLILC